MEIAAMLGVGQATVCRDLKALHAEWCAQRVADVTLAKARELARIDAIEREPPAISAVPPNGCDRS